MHKRIVGNIISRIILVACAIMLFPLCWAVYDDVKSSETMAFAITIISGAIISGAFLFLFRLRKGDKIKINAKDGLAIVGLSWILLSALGALPLYISQVTMSYTDAFFEITSGFTTTGSTIFTDVEVLPRGILFWRSLTHWLGGMGIIVLYIALLPALGINVAQLYKAEAPGLDVERVEPRLKEIAKTLWTIYFLFTFSETVLLMIGGMPFFDALCHTFGTVATGGFSTKNASIGAYSPYIQIVVMIFMFLAGVNFILHFHMLRGRPKAVYYNEGFRFYLFIILLLTPIFAIILANSGLTQTPLLDSSFQILAILTTTGYATADFELWPHALQFILVLLMFIGGCGGSTSGGMKVIRFLLSIKIAFRSIIQSVIPNLVMPIKYNSKPLPEKMILGVLTYFTIFILLFFTGAAVFTVLESCDIITGMTASISALSNIGPGLGKIGPTDNFAWVSGPGKWVLTFLMLAGRLELYSILILLVPSTWKK